MEKYLSNWQTTLVGLLLIGYAVYKIFVAQEEINLESIIGLLAGIGFLKASDQ